SLVPLYIERVNPGDARPTMGRVLPISKTNPAQTCSRISPRLQLRMGVLSNSDGQRFRRRTASRLKLPSVKVAPCFQLQAFGRAVHMFDLCLGSQEGGKSHLESLVLVLVKRLDGDIAGSRFRIQHLDLI